MESLNAYHKVMPKCYYNPVYTEQNYLDSDPDQYCDPDPDNVCSV